MVEQSIFDIYTEEEILKMKAKRILESLDNILEKRLMDFDTVQMYKDSVKKANSLQQVDYLDRQILEQKQLEIHKRSVLTYILDYKANHLITDYTKDICMANIINVRTLDELEEVENRIENIIKAESKKIINSYNELRKQYDLENNKRNR